MTLKYFPDAPAFVVEFTWTSNTQLPWVIDVFAIPGVEPNIMALVQLVPAPPELPAARENPLSVARRTFVTLKKLPTSAWYVVVETMRSLLAKARASIRP